MPKTLVVYYSLTGHTRDIAEAIAAAVPAPWGAEVERIEDLHSRSGVLGYLRSGWQAMTKRPGDIRPTQKSPGQYDLLVLGTPVWAANLSAPMRAYIAERGGGFAKVAFFCTEGSSGGEAVFKQMAELCGKQPVATLIVTQRELKSKSYTDKLTTFCQTATAELGTVDAAPSA